MKTICLIVVCLSFIFSDNFAQQKSEIDHLLTEWHNAASAADQDKFFSYIDSDGMYIGTDSTEVWTKQEFYQWSSDHFNNQKTWTFKATQRNIYFSEDRKVAWFDELIDYGTGTLRGSGVLENRQGAWKIKHYVLSVPVPNEKFAEVMKVIRGE